MTLDPHTSTELAIPTTWDELPQFDDGSRAWIEQWGLTMPRLRTDFGRNGRGFIDDLTGTERRDLELIILATPISRAWWEQSLDEGGGGPPDCRGSSATGAILAPDPDAPSPQSERCGEGHCPRAHWPAGGRPACAESFNVFAFDKLEETFLWVRFGGTAVAVLRRYLSSLAVHNLPSYAVVTRVGLESATRDRLEWLKPTFSLHERLKPADVLDARNVAQKAMASWTTVAEEMDAGEASAPANDDDVIDGVLLDDGEVF